MRAKKEFFDSLDSRKITDNKTFWKNIQPFFSEKWKTVNRITPVNENEYILSNDKVGASNGKWTVLGHAKKKKNQKKFFIVTKSFIFIKILYLLEFFYISGTNP